MPKMKEILYKYDKKAKNMREKWLNESKVQELKKRKSAETLE